MVVETLRYALGDMYNEAIPLEQGRGDAMAKKSSGKSKAKELEINIDGNVSGKNVLIGSRNIINLPPEKIKLNSLHQLPPAPADFTGRDELVSQLLSDFKSHKGATISGLTGMGGIGKTALGLFIANQIKDQYPDAQIFLDLKGTTNPLSALDVIRYIILSFEPTANLRGLDETNMQGAYQSVLHGKKVLLFFDNARSAKQIMPLRAQPDCAILVTSRWKFAVPGLRAHQVDALKEEDAVKFLMELCPRVGKIAADLANACAYLPLALRIAGSFLLVNSDWSVEKYLVKLSDRKKRLETIKQSHKNAELTAEPDLLATFELSYNSLSKDNQKLWQELSIFPSSFDWAAASALWNFDYEENKTQGILGVLTRYHLLNFDSNTTRYILHEMLADYAIKKIDRKKEKKTRINHARHYLEVLKFANILYKSGGVNIQKGLDIFDLEWGQIHFAHRWLRKNVNDKEVLELLNEYPNAGFVILSIRLSPKEYIEWLRFGLKAARKAGNKKYIGHHLNNLGLAYMELGDTKAAIKFYNKALLIARETNDHRGQSTITGNLGLVYYLLGQNIKSAEYFKRNLEISRKSGDLDAEGSSLCNLGLVYMASSEHVVAIELFEQALVPQLD